MAGFSLDRLEFAAGPVFVVGTKSTRASVASEFPAVAIGSIYIGAPTSGSTGRMYLKTTHTGSGIDTDWTKFTTTAAD